MKRAIARVLAAAVVAAGGMAVSAPAADADTPGCVTLSEYRTVYRHTSMARVADHFDTGGALVDDYYFYGGTDVVRSYRKCRSFDGGRGRVGVLFDNYTAENAGYYDNRFRLYSKVRNNPYNLVWWW